MIIGTTFKPHKEKVGGEELENWLIRQLSNNVSFHFHTLNIDDTVVVLLEISAASLFPAKFEGQSYIRIGSYTKKLKDNPRKEQELWRALDRIPFEKGIAADNLNMDDVLRLLDYPAFFELVGLPLPTNKAGLLEALKKEEIVNEAKSGKWEITNLGAVLFARKLPDFKHLKRKGVRVILYNDTSRLQAVREEEIQQGYAVGYERLIEAIMYFIPTKEVIVAGFRKKITKFPELAVRELVANAVIHQDFYSQGTSIMIEIFSNRIEITNPGVPLVNIDRFLDSPPKSRNESIASFMRRINICEERGSGIDKIVMEMEKYHLPAPIFRTTSEHTISTLDCKELKEMDKLERMHTCYLHACLKYVLREPMTNASLRERFKIETKNSAIASRIITDAIGAKLIRCQDESVGTKARKYVPYWA